MFDLDVLGRHGTVLLDASRPRTPGDAGLLFSDPVRILRADAPEEVPGVLRALDDETAAGRYVAGMLTYEAGLILQEMPARELDGPLAWFGVYDDAREVAPAAVADALDAHPGTADVREARFDVDREAYLDSIRRIRSLIREGDVYQINYTGPMRFRVPGGDAVALYRRMRRRQPVPYGAWLHLEDRHVLCASPELFVKRDGDRVVTRPMKGTARRGPTPESDRAIGESLQSDPKSRAENLMIVDLLRNDLSMCCRPGSVRVPALFDVEPYDTLTQMTSTVEGTLNREATTGDLLRALFPCGSITGAPKRRAMQRIHELEPEPRGVYCGAIGYAGPGDEACFNVAIRTVVLQGGKGRMGTGSGIVWDSDAESEYEECKLKTRFLEGDPGELRLIETMRWTGGEATEGGAPGTAGIPLWERHANRLQASAEYFGMNVKGDRVEQAIHSAVQRAADDGSLSPPCVVRLTVDRYGRPRVEVKPMPPHLEEPWRLTVAEQRVDPDDPFFHHKTTRRDAYESAYRRARETGFDEAILLNERGEVTEGTRTNLFVRQGDRLLTPPIASGLLGGVYRAYLLDTHDDAEEAVLTLDDLRTADAIYCCNAVRGLSKAVLRDANHLPKSVQTSEAA